MRGRRAEIGFSQRVRFEWFEYTTNLMLAGNDRVRINETLQEYLQDKLSVGGKSDRGNREKVITILLKTWHTVPHGLEKFRDEGLDILQSLPQKDRIVIHWGMAMAVYFFWGAVAAHTGRLLNLQGAAAAVQIQRRIKEEYGDRETVSRAARRVLRSFIDWGVLKVSSEKGVYNQGTVYSVEDPRIVAWLIEAAIRAKGSGFAATKELFNSPSIFPFCLAYISAEQVASFSPRLNILRHGLDNELLVLRENGIINDPEFEAN